MAVGHTMLVDTHEGWSVPCSLSVSVDVTRFALKNKKLEDLCLSLLQSDATDFKGLRLKSQYARPASTRFKEEKKPSTHRLWELLYSDSPLLLQDCLMSLDTSLILLSDLEKLCLEGQLYSALSAVDTMDKRGLFVSIDILSRLLEMCMYRADNVAAKRLHQIIIRLGYDANCILASSLVSMYLACERFSEALQAFNKLSSPNAFFWVVFISTHVRLGKNQEALDLYHRMRQLGGIPDGHILVMALKACSGLASLDQGRSVHYYIVQRGFRSNVFVTSTLIHMYSSCGSMEDAEHLFATSPNQNVVTWNAMIEGHMRHGLGIRALRLYHQMCQRKVEADRITFVSVLKACASVLDLDQGRLIHQQVVERGYDSNLIITIRLIDMYGICGSLLDARAVFDEGPQQNLATWNAMIASYANHEHTLEALSLLRGLKPFGLEATIPTFLGLLKGIADVVTLDQAMLVHGYIIEMGLDKESLIMNTLLNVYGKCGSMKDASRVFDGMPNHDVVTWNTVIGAHVIHGQSLEALQFFHMSQMQGMEPNGSILCTSLRACCAVSAIDEGRLLHGAIIEGGLESDIMVVNNLINMYVKCGDLDNAYEVFDQSRHRDVVTWTTLVAGFVQHGFGEEALHLFRKMEEERTVPNQFTLVTILKACYTLQALDQAMLIHKCIVGRGFDSEVTVINTLIDTYAKCGTVADACDVFERSATRDVVTWTAMMAAHLQHDSGLEALCLFAKMQKEGMEPDRACFLHALKACSSIAALNQGRQIHNQIIEKDLNSDVAIVNALLAMYMKCGSVQDAEEVFGDSSHRDVVTWTSMIGGFAWNNKYHSLLQYLWGMRQVGIPPNDVTFLSLLSACSHMGLVDEGLTHLKSMESLGITPTLEHLTCVVEVLASAGNLDAAEDLLETLPCHIDVAGWMVLLPHSTGQGNVGMGRRCFDYLARLDCRNAAAYVLMSKMYVVAGLREDAASIEELRRSVNAWKKAGKAYIEVDSQTYEFTGGDKPNAEVNEKLEQLTARMKQRGYKPDVNFMLQPTSNDEKENVLCGHCEKQAIAFGLLHTPRGGSIRVAKNLRMCADCHNAAQVISRMERREIIVTDEHCVHVFEDGVCSCKYDYG